MNFIARATTRLSANRLFPAKALSKSWPFPSMSPIAPLGCRTYSLSDPLDQRPPIPASKRIKGVRAVKSDEPFLSEETARAQGHSTASRYDFKNLCAMLTKQFVCLPYLSDDVLHVQIEEGVASAFFFDNGTFVTWGANQTQIDHLLKLVKPFEIDSYSLETEWFDYIQDQSLPVGLKSDKLVLGSGLPTEQAKFVFSSALGRSVKLSSLENLLEVHLEKNAKIPIILMAGKKLPVSRADMLRNIGELFQLRAMVNLNSDLLDLPDYCWSSQKMEDCFSELSKNLDVRPRITIFNKKLDYANEVAEAIRNHLHEQHSLKLEWAIIILISVEIAFSTLHYLETGSFI